MHLGIGLASGLEEANATVSSIAHGMATGSTLTLFVGTDRGLFVVETASTRDEAAGVWRFFFTPETTSIPTNVDELRSLPLGAAGNPAEVRDVVLDGPTSANAQVLWFGTDSGLHKLNLNDDSIDHSGLLLHPGIDGKQSRKPTASNPFTPPVTNSSLAQIGVFGRSLVITRLFTASKIKLVFPAKSSPLPLRLVKGTSPFTEQPLPGDMRTFS